MCAVCTTNGRYRRQVWGGAFIQVKQHTAGSVCAKRRARAAYRSIIRYDAAQFFYALSAF